MKSCIAESSFIESLYTLWSICSLTLSRFYLSILTEPMRGTKQPLLSIIFHAAPYLRLGKRADRHTARSQPTPHSTNTQYGHVIGRVISSHEPADHDDIGSAPGWNALIATIAIVRSVPHRLEPMVMLVFFFSSMLLIYPECQALLPSSKRQAPVSSLQFPQHLQHLGYSSASARFFQ